MSPGPQDSATVLLVKSGHAGWAGLSEILRHCSNVRIVDEVESTEAALDSIARLAPDIIFLDAAVSEMPVDAMLRRIQELNGHTRVFVLAAEGLRDPSLHPVLPQIAAWTSWEFLSGRRVEIGIDAVVAGWHISCQEPAEVIPRQGPAFTARELEVIEGVLAGKTEEHIAMDMGLKSHRVERILAELKEKLGVPTLFLLGNRLGQLGFGPGSGENPDAGGEIPPSNEV